MNFSVLISVYVKEHAEYLDKALHSIFEQTVRPTEVVLVEDGPLTAELRTVVSNYAKLDDTLKVIALPRNIGLGGALNEGLKHCSCELVARMDSDDICKPDRFEKQLVVFQQNPQVDVVGSWIDEFEGSIDNIVSQRRLPEQGKELTDWAKTRNPLNHPTVMFRKSTIMNVGGYQHFYCFEDYYLWIRILNQNGAIYNIQESLLFFRYNPTMIARRGGWKYAITEVHFFRLLQKIGFIGMGLMIKNTLIRFPIRIMPNKIRIFVYGKLLR